MEERKDDLKVLETLCAEQEMTIDPAALQLLVRYCALLEAWNSKINLISRKEDAPVIVKHIFHSLLVGRYHTFSDGENVLDLGTGGGLPGIPLAIVYPRTRFLLVDATGKKIAACKAMIEELGLKNAFVKHTRVEELKGVVFDTVLSRQVAPLDQLCAYAGRLLKKGGSLICLKGGNLDKEVTKTLKNSREHNGFPSKVDLYPIGSISPFFAEKQIVIARG